MKVAGTQASMKWKWWEMWEKWVEVFLLVKERITKSNGEFRELDFKKFKADIGMTLPLQGLRSTHGE